jgi:hypothetical protein
MSRPMNLCDFCLRFSFLELQSFNRLARIYFDDSRKTLAVVKAGSGLVMRLMMAFFLSVEK